MDTSTGESGHALSIVTETLRTAKRLERRKTYSTADVSVRDCDGEKLS